MRRFVWLGGLALAAAAGAVDLSESGVREALRVATGRAVSTTAKPGGFLDDTRIHIKLPKPFRTVASTLRTVGMGAQVDELEVGLNRAAESAVGTAKPVFLDAIKRMSVEDAIGIVRGGDTAATDYFRTATSEPLRERFRPIVADSLSKVGAKQQYDALLAHYRQLPFASDPRLDLTEYATGKALDGLFFVVAEEEKKIRHDPLKRTTALLRQVFGQ